MRFPNLDAFEAGFDQAWPVSSWCDSHVVLAISGGADSVAMLRVAVELKQQRGGSGRLFVAHLNHGLRGEESDADAEWLSDLCGRLGVPVEVGRADVATRADNQGGSLEAAARTARYDFLRQTAETIGARFVSTAHTADDQIETVLHRILRGTGMAGLSGIPFTRPLSPSVSLMRPILAMRRRDVLGYLAAIGQEYRTDASNADPRHTRNRLRNELLPALRERYNTDLDAALLRLAAHAAETQSLVTDWASKLVDEYVTLEFGEPPDAQHHRQARRIQVDCRHLSDQPQLMVREVCKSAWQEAGWPLQAMGFDEWQQLAAMVRDGTHTRSANLPGNVRARREGHALILEIAGLP
jgi:tRNA(Ile)-lysidine synthase